MLLRSLEFISGHLTAVGSSGIKWGCDILESNDLQNQSDVPTNPSIRGESPSSSSSSEAVEKMNQAPLASCPSTPSVSGREVCPTVPLKKVVGKNGTDAGYLK
ncbi:hypothetical protein Adt_35345 [Abeliophyllum distichum]|uniref:Uncharacterized protein n=1 Tax=Abeliophyllum distichum TaxID=126358 RepID=A0ABD1QHX6_9LAMI